MKGSLQKEENDPQGRKASSTGNLANAEILDFGSLKSRGISPGRRVGSLTFRLNTAFRSNSGLQDSCYRCSVLTSASHVS